MKSVFGGETLFLLLNDEKYMHQNAAISFQIIISFTQEKEIYRIHTAILMSLGNSVD